MVGVSRIVLGDGSENLVVQPLLVVVHVFGGLIEHEELAVQLQEIVGATGFALPAAGEPVLEKRVGLGGEAFGVVRNAGAGDAADAVHVTVGHDIPEIVGDPVVGEFSRVAEGFQRSRDLRDVHVGVLAANRIDILGQAVIVLGVAVEEIDVVEQLGAFEELLIFGEPGEARQDFVHAAVLAGDITVPHADARFRRKRLEPGIGPGSHVPGDLQGLLVAADLVAIEQAGEDLVQGVVRGPDLACSGRRTWRPARA